MEIEKMGGKRQSLLKSKETRLNIFTLHLELRRGKKDKKNIIRVNQTIQERKTHADVNCKTFDARLRPR